MIRRREHNMRTSTRSFTAALLVASLAAPALVLADTKFHDGPDIEINNNNTKNATLTASGTVSGLGNENLTAVLDATALVSTICRNKGGNVAPGQDQTVDLDPAKVSVTPDKFGKATFSVTLGPVRVSDLGSNICPNGNWKPEIETVTYSDVSLVITHDGDTLFACGVSGFSSCDVQT